MLTGRAQRGPGLCRLVNTSETNCWDGNQVVTDDIDDFEADDILSQGEILYNNIIQLRTYNYNHFIYGTF